MNTNRRPESSDVEGGTERSESGADGCCSPGSGHGLADHEVETDVAAFSALANDTRYEVLRLLSAADGEVCACEFAPRLDVNQSTTSRALGALYRAGLVDRRKDGRWRYYATTARAEELLAAIDATREAVA